MKLTEDYINRIVSEVLTECLNENWAQNIPAVQYVKNGVNAWKQNYSNAFNNVGQGIQSVAQGNFGQGLKQMGKGALQGYTAPVRTLASANAGMWKQRGQNIKNMFGNGANQTGQQQQPQQQGVGNTLNQFDQRLTKIEQMLQKLNQGQQPQHPLNEYVEDCVSRIVNETILRFCNKQNTIR